MSSLSEISVLELFARIEAGNADAFNTLFLRYYDRIYTVSLQVCKVEVTAKDIAQQVFLKLWEKRQSLSQIRNPEAWLFTVARNQVADLLRAQLLNDKYIRYVQEFFREEEASPEELLILRQQKELLEKSLQKLSLRQQEIYRMNREQGMTYGEIAEKLGISHDTVKEHISKSIEKIRRFIREHRTELNLLLSLIITLMAAGYLR